MLTVIQSQFISLLDGKISGGYPKVVKSYTGALRNQQEIKRQIKNTPEIHVGVREGSFDSKDVKGNTRDGVYTINIYAFEENRASKSANNSDGIALVQWVLDNIKGETITIGGRSVAVNRKGKLTIEDDSVPFIAIVDLEVEINE
jgi:hypothetical protein